MNNYASLPDNVRDVKHEMHKENILLLIYASSLVIGEYINWYISNSKKVRSSKLLRANVLFPWFKNLNYISLIMIFILEN